MVSSQHPQPRAPVISTTAIPRPDLPPPPCPPGDLGDGALRAERPASGSGVKPWPTQRVPAVSSQLPLGPVTTPPPLGDLSFSYSDWSENDLAPRRGTMPRVGDTVLGFKLVSELGRGAFARVFLAHQESLSNRPVALKVTLKPTKEAERLARLQHTNVVPVYSVHTDGPVQIICMPFLGRTTIADLIRAYRADHSSRHTGRKTSGTRAGRTTAVESGSVPKSDGTPGTQRVPTWTWQAEEEPPIVCDPIAVAQVLAQLAAGLTHAHERGILHLDLKPANVLLADTGEPMLLDFNLSFDTTRPDRELIGGTIPYMAIEQLLDLRHRGHGVIDPRTDLYSLGVMAFEMLTSTVPFPASSKEMRDVDALIAARRKGPPSIRALNPAVSPAVEAIVHKLLAADPADRYQTAEQLRIDAERHLANLPLAYAREPSARERFAKWRRRNPGTPARLLAACVIGLALGLGGVAHRQAAAVARTAAVERAQATRSAMNTVRLDLILPGDAAARARGVARANELLAAYGLPDDPNWQKRPEVRGLSETERLELAGDLGELLLLLALAKGQEAEPRPEPERRALAADALKLNRAARSCFPAGAAPPLADRQDAALAALAEEPHEDEATTAADRQPNTRDKFLDAADALVRGRYATAEALLKRVVVERQNHAAAQFCLAYCRQQLGKLTEALDRYETAEVLLPNDPRPAYRRGLIRSVQNDPKGAEAELSQAIAIAPDWGEAYRNRALARYKLGRSDSKLNGKLKEAEDDLNQALAHGSPALHIHLLRACVRDAREDKAGAAADRAAVNKLELKVEGDYLVRGWVNMKTDPKAALEDFKKAEELNPMSLPALQNQAHVLADLLADPEAALEASTKAARHYPEYAPAVAGRAVIFARLGKRDDAHLEIEKARQLSSDPEITYQAACVFALTSAKQHPEDRDKALALLRQSIRDGYRNVKGIGTDPDLKSLHDLREYQQIVSAAETLLR